MHYSVQSFRYSGDRYADLGKKFDDGRIDVFGISTWSEDIILDVESLYYLRPVGTYFDRESGNYAYTPQDRNIDLIRCAQTACWYFQGRQKGKSHEQCAGLLPMDARQNWVMSANARSLMHLFDLRHEKKDTQLETRQLCELIYPHFEAWMPSLAAYYSEKRAGKARLAP